MSRPTYTQKRKWNPIILRQTGNNCFFCKRYDVPLEYGHLNGNADDSRPENLAYMCHPCNCKMINDYDMKFIALEQLRKNEDAVLVSVGMNVRAGMTEDLTSCQAISANNFRIAEQYVTEHTLIDGDLLVKEAVNDIVGICRKNNNTGSQSAVYRYLNTLVSIAYPFTFAVNEKGEDIMRRNVEN